MATQPVVSASRAAFPRRVELGGLGWLNVPALALLVIVPILIGAFCPAELLGGALLAYLNLVIITSAILYFARWRTLDCLVVPLFLAWFAIGWPISSLYFALAYPDASYTTMHGLRYFMSGNTRVQGALLAFLLSYLTVLVIFLRKPARPLSPPDIAAWPSLRRLAAACLWISVVTIGLNALSKIVPLPRPVVYIADGLFLYCNSLLLPVGALFNRIPVRTRILTIVFMGAAGLFYTVGNARGMAIFPPFFFMVGLLFCSSLKGRTKSLIVLVAVLALPLYMVAANTTRAVMGSNQFGNFERRAEVLQERWQTTLQRSAILASTFGRLYSTGGHSIITMTPESVPYVDFNAGAYGWELVTRSAVPSFVYLVQHYAHTAWLKRYDLRITEKTSVELSMVGSFWLLGGWAAVIVGGVVVGFLHAGSGLLLRSIAQRSYAQGLLFLAVVAYPLMWGQNLDLINHARDIVWHFLFAFIVYFAIVRPLTGAPEGGDGRALHG